MIQTILIVIGLVLGAAVVFMVWMSWFWARLDDDLESLGGSLIVPFDARAVADGAVAVVVAVAIAVDAAVDAAWSATRLRRGGA